MRNPISEFSENMDRYMQEIAKTIPLTSSEEAELAQRIKNGDQIALNKLVKANLRFVIKVAVNYQNQGVSLPDLIGAGNCGLIKAAKRFDETKNFRFISYAVWWVRQSILMELADHSRIVRVPSSGIGKISKLDKIYQKMIKERNGEVTAEDMANKTGLEMYEILSFLGLRSRAVALDKELKDGGLTILDTMESPAESDFFELNSRKKAIQEFFSTLNKRERYIMEQFFGFDDIPKTLEEIASHLKITRERVRQVKVTVLNKLREYNKEKANIFDELC